MRLSSLLFLLMFSTTINLSVSSAVTANSLTLSRELKDILINAIPILGKKVTRSNFEEKAILITFFASWWGSCRTEFVQLGEFLNKTGTKKISIIAINWMENANSKVSLRNLHKLVRTFHPVIRAVRSNKEIETHFQPLTNVPISFIFKKTGYLIYGSGKQAFLGKDKLSKILSDIR